MSPFDAGSSPAQFVLLVAFATTTLTLIAITNWFRQTRNRIEDKRWEGSSLSPWEQRRTVDLPKFIRWMEYLTFVQLLMVTIILGRATWSAFADVPPEIDQALVILSFVVLGITWPVLFLKMR